MTYPLSLIMTVLNGGPYLEQAVASLLGQTFGDFEFVVVNNGSSDNSLEILHSFGDPRLRVISLERTISRTEVLNVALEAVCGEYVAVQDADDISLPQRLEIQKTYMDEHSEVALLGAQSQLIFEDGTHHSYWLPPTAHPDILSRSVFHNPFAHSSVMFRRKAAVELGGYPSGYVWAQDYALWILFLRHFRVATVPITLVQIRLHPEQLSMAPAAALIRVEEEYTLRHQASDHPDLSPRMRRLGRVRARLERAVSLSCIGRSGEAWSCFVKSCLLHADVCILDCGYVIPTFLRLIMRRPRLRH